MPSPDKVIVIGAGIGGLAAALSLLMTTWNRGRLLLAGSQGTTYQVWSVNVTTGKRRLELELNRLIRSISEQLRRKGRGRIFVQIGSKVEPGHLTNGIADIVKYSGSPPVVDNASVVSADEFQQVDRILPGKAPDGVRRGGPAPSRAPAAPPPARAPRRRGA